MLLSVQVTTGAAEADGKGILEVHELPRILAKGHR